MNTAARASTAIALVLLTAQPALSQVRWSFSDLDQDGNLELGATELESFGRSLFAAWDIDRDGQIAPDEFYRGLYLLWDADGDADLTEAEYADAWGRWFDGDPADFADLDADGDGVLTLDEFAALGEDGPFAGWAGNGTLGQEQLMAGLRGVMDEDEDLVVTRAEYGDTWVMQPEGAGDGAALPADIVPLSTWNYGDLYEDGFSADQLVESAPVTGVDGDRIGDVEDFIIDRDGNVIALVIEVGGFWDIGDTHVSIPYDEVAMSADPEDGIAVPLTEDNLDEYGFEIDLFEAETAADRIVPYVDDADIPRAWRASEIIGDYARLGADEDTDDPRTAGTYGYVSDLILRDGAVAAVIVQPASTYGTGYRAFPYRGYGTGWTAGSPYYDLPYSAGEVGGMGTFDYGRMGPEAADDAAQN